MLSLKHINNCKMSPLYYDMVQLNNRYLFYDIYWGTLKFPEDLKDLFSGYCTVMNEHDLPVPGGSPQVGAAQGTLLSCSDHIWAQQREPATGETWEKWGDCSSYSPLGLGNALHTWTCGCLFCNVKCRLQKVFERIELCTQERGLQGVTALCHQCPGYWEPAPVTAPKKGMRGISRLWDLGPHVPIYSQHRALWVAGRGSTAQ